MEDHELRSDQPALKVLPWLTLLLPGFLLVGLGALAGRAGRRLREALGRDPYHRKATPWQPTCRAAGR